MQKNAKTQNWQTKPSLPHQGQTGNWQMSLPHQGCLFGAKANTSRVYHTKVKPEIGK
jgi:hypothetical protein